VFTPEVELRLRQMVELVPRRREEQRAAPGGRWLRWAEEQRSRRLLAAGWNRSSGESSRAVVRQGVVAR
jgi:hypothetical protein